MNKPKKTFRQRYNEEVAAVVEKTGDLLRSRFGLWFLGVSAFADSALGLPFTMDPFLAAYIVADRAKALWGYIVTVTGSVLGGVMAYLVAAFFIEQLMTLFSLEKQAFFHAVVGHFEQGSFALSFLGAFSPIPYTLTALVAGALKVNLFLFILGSLFGRACRYAITAFLMYRFGEKAIDISKRNLLRTSIIVCALLAAYLYVELR